jgi:hypothetical protein
LRLHFLKFQGETRRNDSCAIIQAGVLVGLVEERLGSSLGEGWFGVEVVLDERGLLIWACFLILPLDGFGEGRSPLYFFGLARGTTINH